MAGKNPLMEANVARPLVPSDPEERRRFWIERGNAYLWGDAPATEKGFAGQYIDTPRRDLEWAWSNGSYFIQPRFSRG